MSGAEILGLLVLLLAAAALWAWIATFEHRETRKLVESGRAGTTFRVAGAGTMFVPCFDPYVGPGSTIYLPSGDGLYPGSDARAKRYLAGLTAWLDRGAVIHLIIAIPSVEAARRWEEMRSAYSRQLHLHFLAESAPSVVPESDVALLASSIETRHPVVLVNGQGDAGAMWIETLHPVGSRFAYDVRFVPPSEFSRPEIEREFRRYVRAYREMLAGPFVHTVDVGHPGNTAAEAPTRQAA